MLEKEKEREVPGWVRVDDGSLEESRPKEKDERIWARLLSLEPSTGKLLLAALFIFSSTRKWMPGVCNLLPASVQQTKKERDICWLGRRLPTLPEELESGLEKR